MSVSNDIQVKLIKMSGLQEVKINSLFSIELFLQANSDLDLESIVASVSWDDAIHQVPEDRNSWTRIENS